MKDWKGNKKTTFVTLGASNHVNHERANRDFYATDPIAIQELYNKFWCFLELSNSVWECACGNGHLVKGLKEVAPHIDIFCSDIVRRDFPCEQIDFLKSNTSYYGDIITNPPYKYALEFISQGLSLVQGKRKVIMFLKLTFLESQKRKLFFDKYPPKYVIVFSKRIQAAINGNEEMFKKSSAACYAWFVWEKGYHEDVTIKWI